MLNNYRGGCRELGQIRILQNKRVIGKAFIVKELLLENRY